jgi:hypothetical protein
MWYKEPGILLKLCTNKIAAVTLSWFHYIVFCSFFSQSYEEGICYWVPCGGPVGLKVWSTDLSQCADWFRMQPFPTSLNPFISSHDYACCVCWVSYISVLNTHICIRMTLEQEYNFGSVLYVANIEVLCVFICLFLIWNDWLNFDWMWVSTENCAILILNWYRFWNIFNVLFFG